ncbi:MAG: pantoate--beta-alanine ligase, partial [Solirubrobacteraceae bacterium]
MAAIVGREPRVAVAAIVGPGAERVGAMKVLRTVAEVRAALGGARRAGRVVGLIPTMGAFHEGHLSLMRRAREECGAVVVSLFVNPSQFTEAGDLAVYPRDELRDAMLAAEVGVDHLFAPRHDEIYPPGFVTMVSTSGVATTLEGAHRGHGHFDAVTTIVTKLFNIVSPDVAYFGRKDIQQAHVIERVARDLNLAVRIAVCPTVREPDGLAMSSRNAYLTGDERAAAPVVHAALLVGRMAIDAGERDPARVRDLMADLIAA